MLNDHISLLILCAVTRKEEGERGGVMAWNCDREEEREREMEWVNTIELRFKQARVQWEKEDIRLTF